MSNIIKEDIVCKTIVENTSEENKVVSIEGIIADLTDDDEDFQFMSKCIINETDMKRIMPTDGLFTSSWKELVFKFIAKYLDFKHISAENREDYTQNCLISMSKLEFSHKNTS